MKYISVVIVLILLSCTWSLATGENSMNLEEHRRVTAGVEEDITRFIQRRYPNSSDIFCNRLYTEVLQADSELIAHFSCQATTKVETTESAEQIFEGFLRLKSSDGFKTWSETGGEIISKEIKFLNGFKVTTEAKAIEETEPEPTAPSAEGTK